MQRTDFVTSREDVIKNIQTLYAYAQSEKVEYREWAEARYSQGTWFVVEKIDEQLYFAPSRFVGYKNNTLHKHIEDHGDGTETNRILDGKQKLYKPIRRSEGLLLQFQSFLMSLGFQKKPKKNVKFFIPRNIELSDWVGEWTEDLFYSTSGEYDYYVELLKSNKNLILTGAPGTGKTYMAKAIAKAMNAEIGFVQFHPSYDYTDFVEGLRPTHPDTNGNIGFKRVDGIFKAFCKQALQSHTDNDFGTCWTKLIVALKEKGELEIPLIGGSGSCILQLNKGRNGLIVNTKGGSSVYIEREQLRKVYEGQPGVPKKGNDSYRRAIVQYMETTFNMGKYSVEEHPFVFIIDEINRGEISKIFGELFFSIDPGYRGTKGRVKTQYQNLITDVTDPFYNGFYVPENVYIIGTMNDIDRSVESMDFAMRRRFTWQEIKANENTGMLEELGSMKAEVMQKMQRLNAEIEEIEGLNSSYHIGGAYFCKLSHYLELYEKQEAYTRLWENHLQGLLFEYLRGMANAKENLERLKNVYFKEDEDNQSER